jgi:hypothetical protein
MDRKRAEAPHKKEKKEDKLQLRSDAVSCEQINRNNEDEIMGGDKVNAASAWLLD